jgi:hypothetical protein
MYVPTIARFTARDPMPPDGEPVLFGRIPDGLASSAPYASHPYGYASNNPCNYTDPSGMKICKVPPDNLLDLMKEFLKLKGWADKDRITLALVACVACQESDYDPCAKSGAPAIGVMQITEKGGWAQCLKDSGKSGIPKDGTYDVDKSDCCKKDKNPAEACTPCEKDAWNWRVNIRCGMYYLKWCRDRVSARVEIPDLLCCYNGGPGCDKNNAETKNYIKQIQECIPDMQKKLDAQQGNGGKGAD